MNLIRIAVLGTGSIGSRHATVLHAAGYEPIVISIRAPGTTGGAASTMLAARSLEHAAVMGARRCIIATETGRHAEDALLALSLGFDVLIEKPLDVNGTRARLVSDRSAAVGRKAYVAFNLRFSASMGRFRELLRELGGIHSVRVECQSYLPDWRPSRPYHESYSARTEGGGVLRDLCHEVDYAGWLFGWPSKVQGRLRNTGRLGIDSDESADLAWEGAGGCEVTVRLDYLTRQTRRRMTADGEHGSVEWDGVSNVVTFTRAGGPTCRDHAPQERNEMFAAEHAAFINATSSDEGVTDDRLATCEEGVRSMEVLDAARLSTESRREEAVGVVAVNEKGVQAS